MGGRFILKINCKRFNWLLWIWLVFLILCLSQIWFISQYDIVQLNDSQLHHNFENTFNETASFERFVRQAPEMGKRFFLHNVSESDKVGLFRPVPDTRDYSCSGRSYYLPKTNTSVSVIIAFHNEARSTLLRTIISLYKRTSPKYLHEIILIDDESKDESLLEKLGELNFPPFNYNNTQVNNKRIERKMRNALGSPPPITEAMTTIKMHRNPYRLGLIESRNRGALAATGDYLLFLDSHCEVNVGWLEPLLQRVGGNTFNTDMIAVSPVLDRIDANTLKYSSGSASLMGAFDWNLHFHWLSRKKNSQSQNHPSEPFKSPTTAGGTFMISRNWFFKLNKFNQLLQIWGGESIEFSIKLWLCGGRIEIVPCSRIGHIFFKKHPFTFQYKESRADAVAAIRDADGQATYLRNSKIIAESWLDNYKYFFYTSKPAAKDIHFERKNLESISKMKNDLKCQPFGWFMRNIFPDLRLPDDEFVAYGTLSLTEQCVNILDTSNYPSTSIAHLKLHMTSCYNNDVTHWFLHRRNAHLHSSNGICLNVSSHHNRTQPNAGIRLPLTMSSVPFTASSNVSHDQWSPFLNLEYCDTGSMSQRWLRKGPFLIHELTHLCLDNPVADILTVSVCRNIAPSQYFRFSMELQKL